MNDIYQRLQFHWDNTRQRLIDNGNPPWLLNKTIFRLTTALMAIIGLALFGAAIKPWGENFEHVRGTVKGDWQDALALCSLLLSFLYNTLSIPWVFWHARPVHPLLDCNADFTVWITLGVGVVFAGWGGAFNLWHSITSSDEIRCVGCSPVLYEIGRLELAGLCFGIIVWTMTTLLLIHGCVQAVRLYRYGTGPAGFFNLEGNTYFMDEKESQRMMMEEWLPSQLDMPRPPPKTWSKYRSMHNGRMDFYDLR
ncbi:hypothetical protein ASPWEDRAFT_177335 [Aspergillus wentii DTO 134E9]|uniref:MARVEL domain-containing protein n=1 Tax=Aspergillus wentii DTO 134E9 TaxID=1073089 RepID=A0A1L9R705_ASPWE|nr:uncharacterized protein ASPWEDRAFT_177335 [Aspergillus wentii DTO 134E9]KAI9926655.1 hypothetical protein MW887_003748 [Aspergillus wentii]OJJ30684.1 hypothetical protein ASPWEDRAFT_177335 [Aspergillus wentii DTO 134E9]